LLLGTVHDRLTVGGGDVTATWPVTAVWGVLTVALGYIGIRFLAMSPTTWATYGSVPAESPERVPVDV
jgi:hypothetical protein